jgi:hypothetical protein
MHRILLSVSHVDRALGPSNWLSGVEAQLESQKENLRILVIINVILWTKLLLKVLSIHP